MADIKEKIEKEKRIRAQCTINQSKKLTIWDSRTFKPIINHDDLEPIMATLGFVAVTSSLPAARYIPNAKYPVVTHKATWKVAGYRPVAKSFGAAAPETTWKEYKYSAEGRFQSVADSPPPPRPHLPHPKIDGLHISSYSAFLEAVNFYLKKGDDLSSIFHIRGIPLDPVDDQNKVWLEMGTTDLTGTVYCHGTLDHEAYDSYNAEKNDEDCSNLVIRNKGNDTSADCKMVLLKDIIPDIAGEHDSPSP